jgi:TonB family protein
MTGLLRLAAAAAAALPTALASAASAAPTAEPKRAVAPSGLGTLFSEDDYPEEALAKREEGTVAFRITVGVDGRVSDCTVAGSSGSELLDTATCRILGERARFLPARNAAGQPVTDTHSGRIRWVLPDEDRFPPALNAATELWFACTSGEAAKLALSDLDAAAVATRVFAACAPLEQRVAAELAKAKFPASEAATMMLSSRHGVLATLPARLTEWRAALEGKEAE